MTNINELVTKHTNIADALRELRSEHIEEIEAALLDLDEYDTVEILKQYNGDFHQMYELDDAFDYMTVTEILDELSDIDTSDDYFNADNRTSGCDAWDVAGVDSNDLASQIYINDGDVGIDLPDDIIDILHEAEYDRQTLTKRFKIYDTARDLFNQALKEDPQALVNTLWNMNM